MQRVDSVGNQVIPHCSNCFMMIYGITCDS